MHVHQQVERVFRGLGHGRVVDAHAGVVDEVVERIALPRGGQRGLHAVGEPRERRAVAGVQLQRHGLAAQRLQFAHDGVRLGLVALVREDRVDAALGELQHGAAAEAAAAARDEGDALGGRGGHVGLLVRGESMK